MARKALTDEHKYKYIADNAEVFCERNKKNADKLNGYENLKGEELDKVYKIVQGSIRRANTKANNAVVKSDRNPIEELTNALNSVKSMKPSYTQLENIKKLIDNFNKYIDNKMKDAARTELNSKKAELEVLRNTISELEAKINQ